MPYYSRPNDQALQESYQGTKLTIIVYALIAVSKWITAFFLNSSALYADAFNNIADVLSSAAIILGLYLAKQPADDDHHYGHQRFETITSFLVSLLMFGVAYSVIRDGLEMLWSPGQQTPTSLSALFVAGISALVLYLTYRYMIQLAERTNSLSVKAKAKDLLSDSITSLGTMIAILGSAFGYPWIDTVASIIIGCQIAYTAFEIFRESTFSLSDGFDEEALAAYEATICQHPRVRRLTNLQGRLSGPYVYLDVTIELDRDISVLESHHITHELEQILFTQHGVQYVDVHVEPYFGD